ncbi:MAG: hypothetical protein RBU37_12645 [Myxococcota bacterium]|nr:hypothetical protein [Myxococcota bacterium]
MDKREQTGRSGELQGLLSELSQELSGCSSCSVVHLEEGAAIATISAAAFDASTAEAYAAELLRRHQRLRRKLGTVDEAEELVLQCSNLCIVSRPFEGSEYFWMMLGTASSNVTLIRALMRKYHARLEALLP